MFKPLCQGTTDLPIKPINRPILQDLLIIGITDPINLYIGSVSDRPIMGAIICSSTDNKIGMNSATTNSCLMKIQCMNYKYKWQKSLCEIVSKLSYIFWCIYYNAKAFFLSQPFLNNIFISKSKANFFCFVRMYLK